MSTILLDKAYHWNSTPVGSHIIHYSGDAKTTSTLRESIELADRADYAALDDFFVRQETRFACIVDGPEWTLVAADMIRSYPVFYLENEKTLAVSNSARRLVQEYELDKIDDLSLLEFQMAGYVTGRETLYERLFQLQGGEYLLWLKKERRMIRRRYFLFCSDEIRSEDELALVEELDAITTAIFQRIIDRAGGRKILVPLSGGLDSRLIVCKLKELRYDNLSAFSYGPSGNYEAKAAKFIAGRLEIPWTLIPSSRKAARKFFNSELRRRYWNYADGLSSVPFMQDIDTLVSLKEKGLLSGDPIIINGQTGDFISGGHIPKVCLAGGGGEPGLICDTMIDKHFSLWPHLKTRENLERITRKLLGLIEEFGPGGGLNYKTLECWEWQERQCKYVINGQRAYDFIFLDWELPLWENEYLFFWSKIPLRYKFGQRLYKKYLDTYNFKQLFKEFKPDIWRWPGASICIVPAAFLIGKVFGKKIKNEFYRYMSYWGHYSNHYAPYGFHYFCKNIRRARGASSFYIETWKEENFKKNPDMSLRR